MADQYCREHRLPEPVVDEVLNATLERSVVKSYNFLHFQASQGLHHSGPRGPEDVVQDVYAVATRKKNQGRLRIFTDFRDKLETLVDEYAGKLRPYYVKTLSGICSKLNRRTKLEKKHFQPLPPDIPALDGDGKLLKALGTLSVEVQRFISISYFADPRLSPREIADAMGIGSRAVDDMRKRALDSLKKALNEGA